MDLDDEELEYTKDMFKSREELIEEVRKLREENKRLKKEKQKDD